MADQDDSNAPPTTFIQGAKRAITSGITGAARGAALAANYAKSAGRASGIALAPGQGGDNSNFPDDGNTRY